MEEQVISIGEVVDVLKKRWKLIAIITLATTLITAILSFFVIKPQYEVSTKLYIGKEEVVAQGYNQNDIMMYQKLMKTYTEAIKTKDLVTSALEGVNTKLTTENVLNGLTVAPVADTQIIQIKFKCKNPTEASEILQAIANKFVKKSKELVSNSNIQILETVQVPQNPVSPNEKMNIAIAFILGLMVSIGLCFLLEFLDNTFKTKEQLEKELDIPVIGVIPLVKEKDF